MKSIQITKSSGQTEPFIYYRVKVYATQGAEKPEADIGGRGGDDVDKTIPLALVMKYLHQHPVERVEVDKRTDSFIKKDLVMIVQAHNAAVSLM